MKVQILKIQPGEEERADLHVGEVSPQIQRLADYIGREEYLETVLSCRLGERTFRVSSRAVSFLEALEGRVYVHAGNQIFENSRRLYELERMLPPSFVRISKSGILNLDQVKSYSPLPNGLMRADMKNGEEVYISRKYLREIRDRRKGELR